MSPRRARPTRYRKVVLDLMGPTHESRRARPTRYRKVVLTSWADTTMSHGERDPPATAKGTDLHGTAA